MVKSLAILGSQWGDEGKGRIINYFSKFYDIVVRFQGGNNAGYLLKYHDSKIELNLLPAGILSPNTKCYIANGVAINLDALKEEIDVISRHDIDVYNKLKISFDCHVILPYHVALDKAREAALGASAIGTTNKGIGPVYQDKILRSGIRLEDIKSPKVLGEKLDFHLDYVNFVLKNYYKLETFSFSEIFDSTLKKSERIAPLLCDVTKELNDAHSLGKKILFEGAQGAGLDIDHGSYPYVTSSNTTVGAIGTGSGFPVNKLDYSLNIIKAYATRLGSGPFISEFSEKDDSVELNHLSKINTSLAEYFGREVRYGWLDAVQLKRACMINGADGICLTKLNDLDSFKEIKICIDYHDANEKLKCDLENKWLDTASLENYKPKYQALKGWQTSTKGIKDYKKLPKEAKDFIKAIETFTGFKIALISTSPEVDDVIVIDKRLGEK